MKTEEIFEYVQKQYGTVPEYLWSKSPDSAVLRHKNGKWYAVFMTVEKSKLGLFSTYSALELYEYSLEN